MLPHCPPDAMRHTGHMAGIPSQGDGCGDAVHVALTCRRHSLSRVVTGATHLDRLEPWQPGPTHHMLGAAPTPERDAYVALVPSRRDEACRAVTAAVLRRTSSTSAPLDKDEARRAATRRALPPVPPGNSGTNVVNVEQVSAMQHAHHEYLEGNKAMNRDEWLRWDAAAATRTERAAPRRRRCLGRRAEPTVQPRAAARSPSTASAAQTALIAIGGARRSIA